MKIEKIVKEFVLGTFSICGGLLAAIEVDELIGDDRLLGPSMIIGTAASRTLLGIFDEAITEGEPSST